MVLLWAPPLAPDGATFTPTHTPLDVHHTGGRTVGYCLVGVPEGRLLHTLRTLPLTLRCLGERCVCHTEKSSYLPRPTLRRKTPLPLPSLNLLTAVHHTYTAPTHSPPARRADACLLRPATGTVSYSGMWCCTASPPFFVWFLTGPHTPAYTTYCALPHPQPGLFPIPTLPIYRPTTGLPYGFSLVGGRCGRWCGGPTLNAADGHWAFGFTPPQPNTALARIPILCEPAA